MARILILSVCCVGVFPLVAVFGVVVVLNIARAVHNGGWTYVVHALGVFSLFAIIWGGAFVLLIWAIKAYSLQKHEAERGFPGPDWGQLLTLDKRVICQELTPSTCRRPGGRRQANGRAEGIRM